MRNSIRNHQTVTLDVLDTPNLVPMFNAYCRAASAAEDTPLDETSPVPCEDEAPWRKHFAKAGIFVENSSRHFTVISTHKGGVCYHWKKDPGDECLSSIDLGVVAKSRDGRHFSTQAYNPENEVLLENDELHVVSQMTAMRHQVITPFKLVILRILGMTLMRNGHILRWIKQLLVSHLITKRTVSVCKNHRTVTLAPKLGVKDSFESNESELRRIDGADRFSAIHMASQGYWQIQDDAP
jgi:hypothetical protein